MKFFEKLSKQRKNNNMSQEQLADALGVSRQAVSKWESGTSMPDMEKIMQLCKTLNCALDELVDDGATGNTKSQTNTKPNINTYLKEILDFITKTLNMFWSMRTIEKIKCILEMLFLLLIMYIGWNAAGYIIRTLFYNFISMFPETVTNIIYSVSTFIYGLFGLIVGFIIFIHIFKIRYLDYFVTIEDNNTNDKTIESPVDEQTIEEPRTFIEHKKNKIIIRDPKHSTYTFFSFLAQLVLWGIKFFLILFAIPCIFCFICLVFGTVMSIWLIKDGIFFLGATIFLLGCIFANYIVLKIIYMFILDIRNNFKRAFIIFVIGLALIGIGSAISFCNYLTFNKNAKDNYTEYTTTIKEIDMNNNIILDFYKHYNTELIEDNSLNNIKIEITHPKENEINIYNYIEEDKNIYDNYTYYDISYYTEYDNFLDDINYLIDNIKDKNRIDKSNYRETKIKIYASSTNLDVLNNNYKNKYN